MSRFEFEPRTQSVYVILDFLSYFILFPVYLSFHIQLLIGVQMSFVFNHGKCYFSYLNIILVLNLLYFCRVKCHFITINYFLVSKCCFVDGLQYKLLFHVQMLFHIASLFVVNRHVVINVLLFSICLVLYVRPGLCPFVINVFNYRIVSNTVPCLNVFLVDCLFALNIMRTTFVISDVSYFIFCSSLNVVSCVYSGLFNCLPRICVCSLYQLNIFFYILFQGPFSLVQSCWPRSKDGQVQVCQNHLFGPKQTQSKQPFTLAKP